MIKALRTAAAAIKESNFLVVASGSGMGFDSGLPDLRTRATFYKTYPHFAKLGLTFPEVYTPSWFLKDPAFAWGFFAERYRQLSSTTPNKGFSILKSWCEAKKYGYFVKTSTIHGQFQKTGFPQEKVIECRGSLHYLQCVDNYKCIGAVWPAGDLNLTVGEDKRVQGELPKCIHCQGIARPNIEMYGDWGWVRDRADEQVERFEEIYRKLEGVADKKICIVEIGAGLAMPDVRKFSESFLYKDKDAVLVRINPNDTKETVSEIINLPYTALVALEELDDILKDGN